MKAERSVQIPRGIVSGDDPQVKVELAGERVVTLTPGQARAAGRELLEAAEIDGLRSCSMCGTLFRPSVNARKARRGTRRFCSDACRAEGKRQANRENWHRNRDRWPSVVQRGKQRASSS